MIKDLVHQHQVLGPAVTRIITEYVAQLDNCRVTPEATPGDLEKLFDEPLPDAGMPIEEILERFTRDIAPHAMMVPSPRYFGQFNPTPLPIAVWADALASTLNQNGGLWRNGPTSAIIEARTLRWLCDLVGYGPDSFGTLASGGSEANLIGLKCARDNVYYGLNHRGVRAATADLVIFASEQSHYSIEKSADILGLGRASVRKIPTDDQFHIRVNLLREAIRQARDEGRLPCCVIGVAGTTSGGVVDPLKEVAAVARENSCWFHVDAAYGGSLVFSRQHRDRLNGIEEADSITLDPHKWLAVPFACGAVLTKGGGQVLREAFDITPEYLTEDRGGADVEYDFYRYGQLGTRRFNSLKLWMALKFMGRAGYADMVDRQVQLTKYFAGQIDDLEEFERVGPVETAVCCFKFLPVSRRGEPGEIQDRLQQRIQQKIERGGEAWLTTTVLHGRRTLRVNVNSFLTERRHLDDLVELLKRTARELM